MIREDVYSAIFNLLAPLGPVAQGGNGTLVLSTRRLKHVEDVDVSLMPVVYQNQVKETPFQDTLDGPFLTSISLEWYVYVGIDPNSDAPSTPVLNPIIDAIAGLFPSILNRFTLQADGQACSLRRGSVEYFEGLLGSKAVAKIEVQVIVPFV